MSFFDTQNPGIGGLDELTNAETLVVQAIAALGDPNADRILFWDDSAGSYGYLSLSANLSITGTTLDVLGGGGTIDGTGVANEIAYWVDVDTLGSLATTTYPSLTELSRVKGVTSGIQTQLDNKLPTSYLDTDTALAANSDVKIPSQKAVKAYIDNSVTGLLDLKGSTDCSANPNYPSALKGDSYYVTVAGRIGGASGKIVEIGDVYVASLDNAGGTEAGVGTSWFVLQSNLSGVGLTSSDLSQFATSTSAVIGVGSIQLGHASDTTIARVSAGVASIEGNNIVTNTSSPTLGTITTTGNIELGNASDTTLSRVSAGVVAIEGINIVKAGAVTTNGITMSTARLLGRSTASTGAIEEITVGSGLSLSGGSLTATSSGGFPVQDIPFSTTTTGMDNNRQVMTSIVDGSVMFFAQAFSSGSTIEIVRLEKDTNTQDYKITNKTTLSANGGVHGMAVLGSYLYVSALNGGTGILRRYDVADLANVTTMTISGINSFGSNAMWTDGTDLYAYTSSGTFKYYSISGTTATEVTNVSYTSAGVVISAICDGTNVYMSDSNSPNGTFTIRKYPVAGGSATSTSTPQFFSGIYYQSPNNGGLAMFLASSSMLGIGWYYSTCSPTAALGASAHLLAITLP